MKILASGPVIKSGGMLPRRVVLRVRLDDNGIPTEYVVHQQGWNGGQSSFCYGHYFPCSHPSAAGKVEAYENAVKKFTEKVLALNVGHEYAEVCGPESHVSRS